MIEIKHEGSLMVARVDGEATAFAHRVGDRERPWVIDGPDTVADDISVEEELRALTMRRLEDAVVMAERGLRAAQERLAKAKEETK